MKHKYIAKKAKCTLVQALRLCTGHTAHRGSRGIALLFHDHGTRRGWGVSVTPWPLFTPGKDSVPIVQEAGWGPGPVWTGAENLSPTGIWYPDRPARSQSLYDNATRLMKYIVTHTNRPSEIPALPGSWVTNKPSVKMSTPSSSRNDKLGAGNKSNTTFGVEILNSEWDGEICTGNYWDHHSGFRRIRSTTVSIFWIRRIFAKEWEYNERVHRILTGFKKAYGSVRREVLYNTVTEFVIPLKLVELIKVCLNETSSRVRVGKHLSDMFPIMNDLKQA